MKNTFQHRPHFSNATHCYHKTTGNTEKNQKIWLLFSVSLRGYCLQLQISLHHKNIKEMKREKTRGNSLKIQKGQHEATVIIWCDLYRMRDGKSHLIIIFFQFLYCISFSLSLYYGCTVWHYWTNISMIQRGKDCKKSSKVFYSSRVKTHGNDDQRFIKLLQRDKYSQ